MHITTSRRGGTLLATLTGLLLIWGTETYAHDPATGVGLAFLIIAVGQAVGSPALGALSEHTDPLMAFIAAAAIAVLGAFVRPAARWKASPPA